MKFTELDFDGLECVLEHLELTDLLNVADSCKRLRKAAELVYIREYGKKCVKFSSIIEMCPDQSFKITKDGIVIIRLKTGLQLLRCVGHTVSKIDFFDQTYLPTRYNWLFTYINKYCAEYLKEFMITGNQIITGDINTFEMAPASKYFEIPFPNVVRLRFINYNFNENCCIRRLFPNLQELVCDQMKNASFFTLNTYHFPHLETFQISGIGCIEKEMILAFLCLNPQLKKFTLWSNSLSSTLNIDLIRDALVNLQNIEELGIDELHPSNNLIYMKNVKSFRFSLVNWNKIPECSFPFLFEKLEKFYITFPMPDCYTDNSFIPFETQFFDFIEQHPTITCIGFTLGSVNWLKLAEYLPSLQVIKSRIWILSIGDVLDAMPKFQMLKQVHFKALRVDYDKFCTRLDNKWTMTIDPHGFIWQGPKQDAVDLMWKK